MAGSPKTKKTPPPSSAQGKAMGKTGGGNAKVSKQTKAMGRVGGGNKSATVESSVKMMYGGTSKKMMYGGMTKKKK